MEFYQKLEELMYQLKDHGVEVSEVTGAVKIGHYPQYAPNFWANCIYPTVNESDIIAIEEAIRKKIPEVYKDFMCNFSNGLSVWKDLSLYGKRDNYRRDNHEFVYQPFNLIELDTYMIPRELREKYFGLGSYSTYSEIRRLFLRDDNSVFLIGTKDYSKILKEWNSFEEMMLDVIPEIYSQYDENGDRIKK